MDTQSAEVETEYSTAHSDARSARSRKTAIIAAILLVILVVGIFAASRYQPLEISGLIGIDHPAGTGETSTSQEFGLKNTGPVGITIVAIKGGRISVSDEVSRVAPSSSLPLHSEKFIQLRSKRGNRPPYGCQVPPLWFGH